MGLNVCLTSNEIVILFDKGFIFLLFFMLFLHNLYDDSSWDVSKYAISLCCCVLSSVKFLPRPLKDLGAYLKSRKVEATSGVVCSTADAKVTSGVACSPVALYVLIGLGISLPIRAAHEICGSPGH